ncbi:DNA-directed RNA polymerase I subunit RPA49 isoform X2 [Electrophorus electricus]|uniref:DNA-directed RNA polymerase I subunit RPA49 isoform X2 n=1 Tax=Electrophorus electricus TaxID=8005 RepID=UPI0015D04034|nr:DNA-directed RNA polymerase I subunit RPA49 isoform X2 [Electrophorus electricus]
MEPIQGRKCGGLWWQNPRDCRMLGPTLGPAPYSATTCARESEANAEQNKTQTYKERVDALIEAFGTTKQKRALSSRRMNEVGDDMLQKAVARAANTIIERKGLEALEQEVAEWQAETESTPFLPLCNRDAEKPEDVYPLNGLLSQVEFELLKDVGEKMARLTSEDLKMKERDIPMSVLRHLQSLPKPAKARQQQACCAWYLAFLIRIAKQRKLNRKFDEDSCPRVIFNKVQKNFTVEKFDNGRLKSTVPNSMVVKLASHCLALLLHMGDQTADLTLLHRDLTISEVKMIELAKAMGLKLSRQPTFTSLEESGTCNEHRMASLELPLVRYEHRLQNRKRKKMT